MGLKSRQMYKNYTKTGLPDTTEGDILYCEQRLDFLTCVPMEICSVCGGKTGSVVVVMVVTSV